MCCYYPGSGPGVRDRYVSTTLVRSGMMAIYLLIVITHEDSGSSLITDSRTCGLVSTTTCTDGTKPHCSHIKLADVQPALG